MSARLGHLAIVGLIAFAHEARAQNTVFGPPFVLPVTAVAPGSVAFDTPHDRVLVLDTGQRHVLWASIPSVTSGAPAWSTLDLGSAPTDPATLLEPQGLAVTPAGDLLVVDTFHARLVLFRIAPDAASYTRDAAFAPALPDATPLNRPRDVAVGATGKVFLLDTANHRVLALDDIADTSWSVFAADAAWGQAYGLGVASDGRVAVAATDAHQIYVYPATGGAAIILGRHGVDERGYRFPRDVAFMPDGGLLVADTWNHRLRVDTPAGAPRFRLDAPGLFDGPVSVACDPIGRIYAVDQGYNRVLAWLGPDAPRPFDLMIRDFVGDTGVEDPVDPTRTLSSPDILLRQAADVDVGAVPLGGLVALPFQEPRYDLSAYVYVEVQNEGPLASTPGQVRLFWADDDSDLVFPDDFSAAGLYRAWTSATSHVDGSWLYLPSIAPHGHAVLGPLVWRPPAPESVTGGDGKITLVARIVHVDDPTLAASGLDGIRHSNNVARRPVTVTRGPFPVGEQNTLVVRARFTGGDPAAPFDDVVDRITRAGQWVSAASHGKAWVDPNVLLDPVILDHEADFYRADMRTPVLDIASEVLGKIPAGSLDGPTPGAEDDVDRLVVVVNAPGFAHQATTGPWPYGSGAATRWLTVSIQGPTDDGNLYAHGLGHQLGLVDLLAHENVVFARPYADGWDNMALPINGVLPLTWEQDLATWVTGAGGLIRFVPRPGNGVTDSGAVDLRFPATLAEGDTVALAVGLTPGVTTFEQETRFYWVESRSPAVGGFEAAVPGAGALVYLATEEISQGQGPVIVRDHVLGTPTINDAIVPVGQSEVPGGTGLEVHVDAPLADGDGYRVTYTYDPPEIGVDLWMEPGDPTYLSPDIWVDNQTDGYDAESSRTPAFSEAPAIEGEENRVYARVRNHGPATAYDVEVAFYFSSPFHTIDGEGAFDYLATAIIPQIAAGGDVPTFVTWTPPTGQGPHHCVRVVIRRQVDDDHPENDVAQRNLSVEESASHSPYPPVVTSFTLSNDEAAPKLVIPRLDGVPTGWTWSFDPPRVLVQPGARPIVTLTVTPSEDTPRCRRFDMQVSGWRPRGDTLVRTGGTQVSVLTKKLVELTAEGSTKACPRAPDDAKKKFLPPWVRDAQHCAAIGVVGCTVPPQPNTEVLVRYRDPAGNPIYRTVITDAYGCYEDTFLSGEGGDWGVDVTWPGDACLSSATQTTGVTLAIPIDHDHDDDNIPDDQECQGDPDQDGIPCVLDADDGAQMCRPPPARLLLLVVLAILALLVAAVLLWRTCPEPPRAVLVWLALALLLALAAYGIIQHAVWCAPIPALLWLLRLALAILGLVLLRCWAKRLKLGSNKLASRG